MEKPLSGEIAIVTGAAQGIGRGIAQALASAGANIVVADVDGAAAVDTLNLVKSSGQKGIFVETDLRVDNQLDRLVDATLAEFGKINILINNAGINAPGGFLGVSREDLRSVLGTNLIGPFILTQRVANEMINQKIQGRMVFISSIHSVVAHYHPHYSISKIGVERLVSDAALELAPYGIRVNGIRPGGIQNRGKMELDNPEIASQEVPLGKRRGLPAEIGDLVLFLVGDQSRYITGTTVTIDGGLSMLSYSSINSRHHILEEQRKLNIPGPDEPNQLIVNVIPE